MFNVISRLAGVTNALVAATLATVGLLGATSGLQAQEGYWDKIKGRGVLRCAYAASAPYMIKNVRTNEYSGAYLDLCRSFAKTIDVKIEFVDTTWDNIIAGLQAGKWDLVPALNRTPARAMVINYSIPATFDTVTLTYRKNNPKVTDPKPDLSNLDVPGLRIGAVTGTSNDFAVTERFKKAEIVRLPSAEALNLALLSGRIDALASSIYINRVFQGANAANVAVVTPEPVLTKNGVSFGLPASTTWRDVQVLNIFLEKLVATGQVDASMNHYGDEMIAEAALKK